MSYKIKFKNGFVKEFDTLEGVDLHGADLHGADLTRVSLLGANLH